jgi:hypothetical protein
VARLTLHADEITVTADSDILVIDQPLTASVCGRHWRSDSSTIIQYISYLEIKKKAFIRFRVEYCTFQMHLIPQK